MARIIFLIVVLAASGCNDARWTYTTYEPGEPLETRVVPLQTLAPDDAAMFATPALSPDGWIVADRGIRDAMRHYENHEADTSSRAVVIHERTEQIDGVIALLHELDRAPATGVWAGDGVLTNAEGESTARPEGGAAFVAELIDQPRIADAAPPAVLVEISWLQVDATVSDIEAPSDRLQFLFEGDATAVTDSDDDARFVRMLDKRAKAKVLCNANLSIPSGRHGSVVFALNDRGNVNPVFPNQVYEAFELQTQPTVHVDGGVVLRLAGKFHAYVWNEAVFSVELFDESDFKNRHVVVRPGQTLWARGLFPEVVGWGELDEIGEYREPMGDVLRSEFIIMLRAHPYEPEPLHPVADAPTSSGSP